MILLVKGGPLGGKGLIAMELMHATQDKNWTFLLKKCPGRFPGKLHYM